MLLDEIINLKSKGNKTNLSGGSIPNAYKDKYTRKGMIRKKKKDVYGVSGD